jgi:TRAP-type C4-dicarboxylate transport system permease small subunit
MMPDSRTPAPRASVGESRLFRALAHAEDGLIILLMLTIFGIVLAGVLSRFVFQASLSWTTEFSVTAMIWLTFLGIAVGVRDRVHVSFELLEDKLDGMKLTILRFVQVVVMGFLLIMLSYGGYELVSLGINQVTPSGIPQWVAFAAIPLGCGLGLVHLAVNAWDLVTGVDPGSADNDPEMVAA